MKASRIFVIHFGLKLYSTFFDLNYLDLVSAVYNSMKQEESPTMLVRLHTLAKMMKELRMTQGILRPRNKNKRHPFIPILLTKETLSARNAYWHG
jgi:hypothetical protein